VSENPTGASVSVNGETGDAWKNAVRGIQTALAAGDRVAARGLFDRLVNGEFGKPAGQPVPQVGDYDWDEVSARTGFEPDDLHERITGWLPHISWLTPDGRCTQAGLDELTRQVDVEGGVAAAAYADAYRRAADMTRGVAETIAAGDPGEAVTEEAVAELAGAFEGLAVAVEEGAQFLAGEPPASATWPDVATACNLKADELTLLTDLLATLTPAGQPTQATIDRIRDLDTEETSR
jgi:hypothetical protein